MKHNAKPSKQDYITFLKEHEQEMTDKVKEKNSKVTSVQWDWDSVDAGEIGNGLPGGAGMALTVHGEFNQIENSSFYVQFDLDENEEIAFKSMVVNPLRIGGRIFYE